MMCSFALFYYQSCGSDGWSVISFLWFVSRFVSSDWYVILLDLSFNVDSGLIWCLSYSLCDGILSMIIPMIVVFTEWLVCYTDSYFYLFVIWYVACKVSYYVCTWWHVFYDYFLIVVVCIEWLVCYIMDRFIVKMCSFKVTADIFIYPLIKYRNEYV